MASGLGARQAAPASWRSMVETSRSRTSPSPGTNAAAGVWAAAQQRRHADRREYDQHQLGPESDVYTLQTPNLVTPNGPVGSSFSVTSAIPISGLFAPGGTINSTGTTINVTTGNAAAGAYVGL